MPPEPTTGKGAGGRLPVPAPTAAAAPVRDWVDDRICGRCGHTKSCHGENGCEVEVRDYGDMDCFCHGFAPAGRTKDGRVVIACYCGGGDVHLHQPNGGGTRILACPPDPVDRPVAA